MQKGSFRSRFFQSMLLILIPIVAFSFFIYAMNYQSCKTIAAQETQNRGSRLMESIGGLLEKCRTLVVDTSTFAYLSKYTNTYGSEYNTSAFCATLSKMEQQLNDHAQVLCYIRGDQNVFSSQQMLSYRDFESTSGYDLMRVGFFSALMELHPSQVRLMALPTANGSTDVAFLVPTPYVDAEQHMILVFLLKSEMLEEMIRLNMGDMPLSLRLFAGKRELYSYAAPGAPSIPDLTLARLGIGLNTLPDGANLLREYFPSLDLSVCIAMDDTELYRQTRVQQRTLTVQIIIFWAMCVLCAVAIFLMNYHPIRQLANEISFLDPSEDALDHIRTGYMETCVERDCLSERLDDQKQLVNEQFCLRLLEKKHMSREEYDFLAHCAGFEGKYPLYAALYLRLSSNYRDTELLDHLIRLLEGFRFAPMDALFSEALKENGVYVLLNLAADMQGDGLHALAQRLFGAVAVLSPSVHMGVGGVRNDPLRLRESYLEAKLAADYSAESGLYIYTDDMENNKDEVFSFAMEKKLLLQAVQSGDSALAGQLLQTILAQKLSANASMRQFQCRDIASSLANEAHRLGVSQELLHRIVQLSAGDSADFCEELPPLVEQLCAERSAFPSAKTCSTARG